MGHESQARKALLLTECDVFYYMTVNQDTLK
jgi:hypothetical protein